MNNGGRDDSRLEERLAQARRFFREHHANVEPDAGFAGRVASRLRRQPAEILGWAAWKLLPATLALAVALAWLAYRTTSGAADVVELESPTDDPIAWVLDRSEAGR